MKAARPPVYIPRSMREALDWARFYDRIGDPRGRAILENLGPSGAAQATADFELGTNGNTIATGDTGSATAWDSTNIGTGSTLAYDTTHTYRTLAAKIVTSATAGQRFANLVWSTAFGTQTDHYGRFYLYCTGNPGGTMTIVSANANDGTQPRIVLLTTGKLRLGSTSGTTDSTNAITLNAWVRIEFHFKHSTTAGQLELKLFNSPDSSTATETLTSASNWNTNANATSIGFGCGPNGPTSYTFWIDNLLAGGSGYPGPYTTAVTNSVAFPFEALVALKPTSVDSFETVQALAVTDSDPVDTTGEGISSIVADPIETLAAVTDSVAEAIEALGGIAKTGADPIDAPAAIHQTAVDPLEALKTILSDQWSSQASITGYHYNVAVDGLTVFHVRADGSIKFRASLDGTASWSSELTIGTGTEIPLDNPVVYDSATGRLHVFYGRNFNNGSTPPVLCHRYSDNPKSGASSTWSAEQIVDDGTAFGNDTFFRIGAEASGGIVNAAYACGSDASPATALTMIRSTDGGATFSSTHLFTGTLVTAGRPNMKRNGSVLHLAYVDSADAYYAQSTDGGATWPSTPTRLTTSADIGRPVVATAGSIVLIVYMQPFGVGIFSDVVMLRSTDGGSTFTGPTTLATHTQKALDHPWVTMSGNEAAIAWCDHQNSGPSVYTVIRSNDGGATWRGQEHPLVYAISVSDAPKIEMTPSILIAFAFDGTSSGTTIYTVLKPQLALDAPGGIAGTASNPVEANRGIAATASDPLDASQVLAQTGRFPLESVQALTATARGVISAIVGIAAAAAAGALETLQGLKPSGSAPVESQGAPGSVAGTAELPVETAQPVDATTEGPMVTGQGVAGSTELPTEAVGSISAASSAPVDSMKIVILLLGTLATLVRQVTAQATARLRHTDSPSRRR